MTAENPQVSIEREEFQRGHVPEGTPPVDPRDAATIVVAKPIGASTIGASTVGASFEVLLLERPQASRFAAGAFVFPGGVADEDDADEQWNERLPATGEPAACTAALRELFEETGILPIPNYDRLSAPEVAEARRRLLDGTRSFSEIARTLELDFSRARVAYFSRWITPRRLSRRYDTRFFLLVLDEGPVDVSLTAEHDSAIWSDPNAALEMCGKGELPMLFPTRKTLDRLSAFESLETAFEALRGKLVEPILAKLDMRGERIRPLMPGDPGYEQSY